MRDIDADEPVMPLKPVKRKRAPLADAGLKLTGLALAAMSAFFPWYVFLNPDKFGIHSTDGDRTRDMGNWPARNVFSASPMAMSNRNETESKPPLDPDKLTTATTSLEGQTDLKDPDAENQPFPGKMSFRLLHVSNGRALIEDSAGMYVVRVGSILPDDSKLASIEQRKGKWVIVTSKGDVY